MNEFLQGYSKEQEIAETKRFFVRVYGWMTLALVITGLMAYKAAISPEIMQFIFGERFVFFGLIILELVLVGVLTSAIHKMTAVTATAVFALYSF
jgi:FtsH-binding integral membrane protein